MAYWKILGIIITTALVIECKRLHHQKREATQNVCDPIMNNTNKVQCFCIKDHRGGDVVRSADCYLTNNNTLINDPVWNSFQNLRTVEKLILTNPRGVTLKYIPTLALEQMPGLLNINVKYGDIKEIPRYAFTNLSFVQEIVLSDNQIELLHSHAFYHHTQLTTITLDKNRITEINRDVFVELPLLEKLFLTSNKITTIHDRAFIHLTNLKELEIDKNMIFSLNSETFSGLRNLNRLELSSNSLEVIGDNTFLPLKSLQSLNLDENKIQMIDEKAFRGLSKLRLLSLARNQLSNLDNVKVFEGLNSLISLNLKFNKIHYLKSEVMEPILHNFYNVSSNLEFDENDMPCDCRLDWLVSLKNKTQNSRLKLSVENLKCTPNVELTERWKKIEETERSSGASFADDAQPQNEGDYEYYDESQLGGKLFYIDVRDLLNCTNAIFTEVQTPTTPLKTSSVSITTYTSTHAPYTPVQTSTVKIAPPPPVTANIVSSTTFRPQITKIAMQGVLDLSLDEEEQTEASTSAKPVEKPRNRNINTANYFPVSSEMVEDGEKPTKSFTTSRLATVSAKPTKVLLKKYEDNKDMASDEAAPPAHRQIQNFVSEPPKIKPSNANTNVAGISILIISILTFFYRLV